MKPALIITQYEISTLIAEHLEQEGYDASDIDIIFANEAIVVTGATKIEDSDEDEDEEEDDDSEKFDPALATAITETLKDRPMSENELRDQIRLLPDLSLDNFRSTFAVLCDTGAVRTPTAAYEDGQVVKAFMTVGPAFNAFEVEEAERVKGMVEKYAPRILELVPGSEEPRATRNALVDRLVEGMDESETAEVRRSARSIFYAMAESKVLHHTYRGWRAYRTSETGSCYDPNETRDVEGTVL